MRTAPKFMKTPVRRLRRAAVPSLCSANVGGRKDIAGFLGFQDLPVVPIFGVCWKLLTF